MPNEHFTTGVAEIDRWIGGVLPGDNIVFEVDSGAPVDKFMSSFISASDADGFPIVYVSFNHSPQTIADLYAHQMLPGRFILVDCFSCGKGNSDKTFLDFFENTNASSSLQAIQVTHPEDSVELQNVLSTIGSEGKKNARYIFDSLTGMFDLWSDEDIALRFFGHLSPRLFDLNTIAYWLLEKEAHTERFMAKLRHTTQVVLEVAVSQGIRTLTLRKAVNRRCVDIGVPQWFRIVDDHLVIAAESRENREIKLLARMSDALGTALDLSSFLEQTMTVLGNELGLIRGTVILLDRMTNKLRIMAAHGLSAAERDRGEYAIGEGITGHVVKTGTAEVIPDIRNDPRFLDRTASRKTDTAHPIAFICTPINLDGEIVGALSVDRPFAVEANLDKDLRLLSIVAAIISQVLKINRLIHVEKEELLLRDETILQQFKRRYRIENLVGQSAAMERLLATAAIAAKSRASILITGETGTGKEMVANVIHYNSAFSSGPFIKVNCGALPETLLESELFGHVKGAFTGAVDNRKGRFELADGGTLFLDEVAEMSPRLQVKLLRVLQEKEFEPVGGIQKVSVNVRVVAATNKNLRNEVQKGHFREDLYYRLNVIPIQLPSLRDRREDIPLLVNHFLEKYNQQNDKNVTKISQGVLDLLLKYPWPGNVRELENCIERAVVMSPSKVLSTTVLPEEIISYSEGTYTPEPHRAASLYNEFKQIVQNCCNASADSATIKDKLCSLVEETMIRWLLSQKVSQRNIAKRLGMSRTTLRKKMHELGILP